MGDFFCGSCTSSAGTNGILVPGKNPVAATSRAFTPKISWHSPSLPPTALLPSPATLENAARPVIPAVAVAVACRANARPAASIADPRVPTVLSRAFPLRLSFDDCRRPPAVNAVLRLLRPSSAFLFICLDYGREACQSSTPSIGSWSLIRGKWEQLQQLWPIGDFVACSWFCPMIS
jgi:hypothetical protein